MRILKSCYSSKSCIYYRNSELYDPNLMTFVERISSRNHIILILTTLMSQKLLSLGSFATPLLIT